MRRFFRSSAESKEDCKSSSRGDAKDVSDFLRNLLKYDPKLRVSAKDALALPWLRHVGDPDDVAL